MTDREKAIKELTNLPTTIYNGCYQLRITHDLRDEIVKLLKEQEAELSYREAKAITHTATKLDDVTCPSCGNVVRMRYDYCHYCGQKLDWEGEVNDSD